MNIEKYNNFLDNLKARTIHQDAKKLKLDKKPVEMVSLKIDDKAVTDNDDTVIYVDQLLKDDDVFADKLIQVTFHYDNVASFSITKGFYDSSENLADNVVSFFDEYGVKNRIRDRITAFDIFYVDKPETAGGKTEDKNNNCLYYILRSFMSDRFPWATTWTFKRYVKLKANEKVPIEALEKIENKLKINIIVSGSVIRDSSMKYIDTLRITLNNGHYEFLDKQTMIQKQIQKKYFKVNKEMPLIVYKKVKGKTETYDGKIYNKNETEFKTKGLKVKCQEDANLQEFYHTTYADYELLKSLSDGKYNPFKYTSLVKMSEELFLSSFKGIEPEKMELEEALVLDKAMGGGLRMAEPGIYKNAHDYDINRFYPYLQTRQLKIPLQKPKFKKLESLPNAIPYGIYKCFITSKNKLLKRNRYNLYTHYDLRSIRSFMPDSEFTLINDNEKWNAMIYEGKFADCSRLKKDYEELYNISKKGCNIAKIIMNALWGAISKREFKMVYSDREEVINVSPIDKIRRLPDCDVLEVEKRNIKKLYANDIGGRFSVFLCAKGRFELNKILQPHIDKIKYVHTDGWISTEKLDVKLGVKFGDIRLEKIGKCKVINKNIKKWLK